MDPKCSCQLPATGRCAECEAPYCSSHVCTVDWTLRLCEQCARALFASYERWEAGVLLRRHQLLADDSILRQAIAGSRAPEPILRGTSNVFGALKLKRTTIDCLGTWTVSEWNDGTSTDYCLLASNELVYRFQPTHHKGRIVPVIQQPISSGIAWPLCRAEAAARVILPDLPDRPPCPYVVMGSGVRVNPRHPDHIVEETS